jgi:hypothetical protein
VMGLAVWAKNSGENSLRGSNICIVSDSCGIG